jgi:hypothetical protein
MLKIQFRRKLPLVAPPVGQNYSAGPFSQQPFGQPFGQKHVAANTAGIPCSQETNTCLFCGGEITGSHLEVSTKSGGHRIHMGCVASGFALLANDLGLLFNWLKERRK